MYVTRGDKIEFSEGQQSFRFKTQNLTFLACGAKVFHYLRIINASVSQEYSHTFMPKRLIESFFLYLMTFIVEEI